MLHWERQGKSQLSHFILTKGEQPTFLAFLRPNAQFQGHRNKKGGAQVCTPLVFGF